MAQKYRRIAEIGRGGMAALKLAVVLGGAAARKLVVLKELLPDLALDAEFRSMFMDAARLASRLNHANVVQTFEVTDEDDGSCAIVMEYLEGQPLSRVRSRLKTVAPDELFGIQLRVIVDLLTGLDYAHTLADFDGTPLRIVHRDVSPHNVFVTFSGSSKVLDCGIAKASDSSSQTRTGTMKGKRAYMSPEQARGDVVDPRADIYSVGVMLWEAVVGRRIWSGLNDAAILHRLLTARPPSPCEVAPEVAEPLDAVVRRAMAPSRDERYTTAAEMRAAIEGAITEIGFTLPNPVAIGVLLERAFADDRANVRAVIDEQMRVAEGTTTAEHPALSTDLVPLPAPSVTGSRSGVLASGRTGGSALTVAPKAPASEPWRVFGIAAGLAVLAGIGLFFAIRAANGDGTPALAAASADAAPAGPKVVHVRLDGVPAGALVTVDGQSLPHDSTVVDGHAGDRRAIRVIAPGFETLEFPLDVAGDGVYALTLVPVPAAALPPARTTHTTATALTRAAVIAPPSVTHATAKPPSSGVDLGY
ncbi:hypothetical protein BH09MYX1_BH09MYX1_39740 [soil metagenome]